MNSFLPSNLIFGDSYLNISFEENVYLNKTKNSIIIEGSRGGFLSLSNAIFYYLNRLEEVISLHKIPFVSTEIEFIIECNEFYNEKDYGKINKTGRNQFIWRISETHLCACASEIHSLGHINNELHFDYEKSLNDITIYCVVSLN